MIYDLRSHFYVDLKVDVHSKPAANGGGGGGSGEGTSRSEGDETLDPSEACTSHDKDKKWSSIVQPDEVILKGFSPISVCV